MGRKQFGSKLDGTAQKAINKLRATTDGDVRLAKYAELCSLVGRDVADRALDEATLSAIKAAHDRKFHPKPVREDKKGGDARVGQRHTQARTA